MNLIENIKELIELWDDGRITLFNDMSDPEYEEINNLNYRFIEKMEELRKIVYGVYDGFLK